MKYEKSNEYLLYLKMLLIHISLVKSWNIRIKIKKHSGVLCHQIYKFKVIYSLYCLDILWHKLMWLCAWVWNILSSKFHPNQRNFWQRNYGISHKISILTYFCMSTMMLMILPASPATPVTAVSTPEMAVCHQDKSEASGNPQVFSMRPRI